jgi:dipeptidyl-peptidase-4
MKNQSFFSKRSIYVALIGLLPMLLWSQPSAFSLETAVLGGAAKLSPLNLSQLAWIPGTERFSYVAERDGQWQILSSHAAKADLRSELTLEAFNKAIDGADLAPMQRFPAIVWTGPATFRFESSSAFYGFDLQAKKASRLVGWAEDAANHDVSSKESVAYTVDQNLFVSGIGSENTPVTKEQNHGIRHGESTHRNEFGISKGTFWSPDGQKLAFYRTDETMVTDYPILDFEQVPASNKNIKYPFAGQKSHHATIGVYDLNSHETIYLKTGGDPEHYLTNVTWTPDGREIWVVEVNRGQDHVQMFRYDSQSGQQIAKVFEEKHPKYIQPQHGPIFIPGLQEFLWLSERDGFNHLYHYRYDGSMVSQLTSGPWAIINFLGFDTGAKNCFIETTLASATERHFHALNLKSKELTPITPGKGTHRVLMHPSGKYFLDNWSAVDLPRIVRVQDAKGKTLQELLKAQDPLATYGLPKPELFQIKAADGKTDLWSRLIKPMDFDPAKKYPVLVYVYNGPNIQLIQDTYLGGAPGWMYWLATQGYLVWTVDGRGSANRGLEFEQATFRNLGAVETADQLEGVEYLKSLPFVDASRMVVHGWSYGGFMTCNLMLRSPGVFNAGVAGGPVINWDWYEVMYTERYMDTPESNPDGYASSSILKYIPDLKGKLMLIHGTSDDVVVWQHSLEAVEEAVKRGVQLDYFVYPMHPHNVNGKDRLHLMKKVLDYLMEAND